MKKSNQARYIKYGGCCTDTIMCFTKKNKKTEVQNVLKLTFFPKLALIH